MSTDLDHLQGTWNVTSLEMDGQQMPAMTDAHIVIKKDKFESVGIGAVYEGRIEIDSEATPKAFDLIFTTGPEKGNRNPGIYKLEANRWTICLATRENTRPDKFESRPNSGFALETLERSAQPLKPQKSRPAEPTASGTPTLLEGEWAMIGAVFNGASMDKKMMEWCKRLTRGNVTTVTAGPQVMLKATFTLAESNKADIDYVNLEGPNKGKAQAGIFSLKGDTLEICMAAPGKPRPSDFSSKAGDGRSYTTWRLLQK